MQQLCKIHQRIKRSFDVPAGLPRVWKALCALSGQGFKLCTHWRTKSVCSLQVRLLTKFYSVTFLLDNRYGMVWFRFITFGWKSKKEINGLVLRPGWAAKAAQKTLLHIKQTCHIKIIQMDSEKICFIRKLLYPHLFLQLLLCYSIQLLCQLTKIFQGTRNKSIP